MGSSVARGEGSKLGSTRRRRAVEKKFELTRRCLEVIAAVDEPPPTLLMTRSTLVLRDLDVLRRIKAEPRVSTIPVIVVIANNDEQRIDEP